LNLERGGSVRTFLSITTMWTIKTRHLFFSITQANIDRFS